MAPGVTVLTNTPSTALHAQLAEQAAAAAADRAAGRQDGLHAARATAEAAGGRTLPRPTQHREPGDAERMAAVRAELAARPAAAPGDRGAADEPAEAWPATREPGSGPSSS